MIYFDITKTGAVRHRSGLARLSERLREELKAEATPAAWTEVRDRAGPDDWFVTSELFSEAERPGFRDFVRGRRHRCAAIFADAIPLKFPHITWPHSVARHPHYLKALADFGVVWAISEASRVELVEYWRWLGLRDVPPVDVLPLGADFDPATRATRVTPRAGGVLCVGILEPRKNQTFLLDVCEDLWRDGLEFDLHLVGRVNPHFGGPVLARIKAARRRWRRVRYHAAASDAALAELYATVQATACPTLAEGCGLPLLESLWRGVPCVCSDLPVLRENADGGGCLPATVNDRAAWAQALRIVLGDEGQRTRLSREAVTRPLPTWAEAAERLRAGLR